MKIGIISVTKQGDIIAEKIGKSIEVDIFSKNNIDDFDIKRLSEKLMMNYKGVIFISSTGIAVRSIAPFLKGKAVDPAVLVIDSCGNFVISLISGHLGGANELTIKIANILGAEPIITTATDNLGLIAPDMIAKENDLIIEDLKKAKTIAAKLVCGEKISFIDEMKQIPTPKGYVEKEHKDTGLVYVTNKLNYPMLKLIRKNIVLGIGCKKNFDPVKMQNTVDRVLKEYNFDKRAVKAVATVEIKKDEKAILELTRYLDAKLNIFSLAQIKEIEHEYPGSDFVKKSIGVRAVCEPVVQLSGAKLLSEKIRCDGMTICIGEELSKED